MRRISHICLGCGHDLARSRAVWSDRVKSSVVECPRCGRFASRQTPRLGDAWRRGCTIAVSLIVIAVQAGIIWGALMFTIAWCAGIYGAVELGINLETIALLLGAVAFGWWLTVSFSHWPLWRVWVGWVIFVLSIVALMLLISFVGSDASNDIFWELRKELDLANGGLRTEQPPLHVVALPYLVFGAFGLITMMVAALPGIVPGKLTLMVWHWNRRIRRRKFRQRRLAERQAVAQAAIVDHAFKANINRDTRA